MFCAKACQSRLQSVLHNELLGRWISSNIRWRVFKPWINWAYSLNCYFSSLKNDKNVFTPMKLFWDPLNVCFNHLATQQKINEPWRNPLSVSVSHTSILPPRSCSSSTCCRWAQHDRMMKTFLKLIYLYPFFDCRQLLLHGGAKFSVPWERTHRLIITATACTNGSTSKVWKLMKQ